MQDPLDSTLWTGTIARPDGPEPREDLRFVVAGRQRRRRRGPRHGRGRRLPVGALGDVDTSRSRSRPARRRPARRSASRPRSPTPAGQPIADRRVVFTVVQSGRDPRSASTGQRPATGRRGARPARRSGDLPSARFTVTAYIFDAQNCRQRLRHPRGRHGPADRWRPDVAASPLGVVATVTTSAATPWAGRTVRVDGAAQRRRLSTTPVTDADRRHGGRRRRWRDGKIPPGPLTVRAAAGRASGGGHARPQTSTCSSTALVVTPDPTVPDDACRARRSGLAIKVSLSDARGPVDGRRTAGDASRSRAAARGDVRATARPRSRPPTPTASATSPVPTARPTHRRLRAHGDHAGRAPTLTVPMAAQYGFGAFVSPVNTRANAINGGSGNLPLKWTVLGANNKAIPDAEAARCSPRPIRDPAEVAAAPARTGLVRAHRPGDPTTRARTSSSIDLKTTDLGMIKPNVYEVEVRILPTATDPKPGAGLRPRRSDVRRRVGASGCSSRPRSRRLSPPSP